MKRSFTAFVFVFAAIVCTLPQNTFADDPKARAIMEKVDARDDGDNQVSDMEMILIDKKGKERIRKIHAFSKDKGEDTLNLMFFQHPADVKDTAFLTFDYDDPDKDDDQWLYLPALRKTKRIASTDKSGSFMGSDLTYSDMTSRNLEDYDYTFYEKGKNTVHKTVLNLSNVKFNQNLDFDMFSVRRMEKEL